MTTKTGEKVKKFLVMFQKKGRFEGRKGTFGEIVLDILHDKRPLISVG
jgi:hypothetical protein